MTKPATAAGIVTIGLDVLTTTVSKTTRRIMAQVGNVLKDSTENSGLEWWQHVGFVSRPPKPEAGKQSCQTVVVKQASRDAVIASQDARGLDLSGNIDHGETCLYAAGEDGNAQGRFIIKKNGSLHLFTKKGNTKDGKGITFSINSDGSVNLVTSEGTALQLGADGTARLFTPNGSFLIDAAGNAKMIATKKAIISGTSVAIGGGPASAAVVTATELLVIFKALSAALKLITPGATTTGGAPAAAALDVAIGALTAALATKRTTAD